MSVKAVMIGPKFATSRQIQEVVNRVAESEGMAVANYTILSFDELGTTFQTELEQEIEKKADFRGKLANLIPIEDRVYIIANFEPDMNNLFGAFPADGCAEFIEEYDQLIHPEHLTAKLEEQLSDKSDTIKALMVLKELIGAPGQIDPSKIKFPFGA
jgi:hypothetical protein